MATRFGRAGGGNWSAAGTWSATSGGGSDGAGINTGDDVVLDANSTGTFTIDSSASINSIVCTGFTGTLSHTFAGTLTVSGNTFTLSSGMTYVQSSSSRTVTFTSTSGTTAITTAGKTPQAVIFNGAGGTFQLQDALTTASANSGLTLTAGTLDLNGQTATVFGVVATGSSTRVLTFGAGSLVVVAPGTVDLSGTGFTVNKNTGTMSMTGNTSANRTFNLGAVTGTLPPLTLGSNTNIGAITFSGTSTLDSLAITAPNRARFTSGVTFTIANPFTISGSSSNRFQLCSSTPGSTATISIASGSATIANAFIEDLTFGGGATFTATNSYNVANNSGITITEPSSGSVGVIGG